MVEAGAENHPVLRSVGEIFAESDVYVASPPADCAILMRGQVTTTLEPDSPALEGKKNKPMMPVVWVRERKVDGENEGVQRVVTTTMGAASDLDDANLRRLVVNGVFWALKLDVPTEVDVTIEGDYDPTFYGFGTFQKGEKPEDFLPRLGAAGASLPAKGERIAIVGGGFAERMIDHGFFETELYTRFPQLDLVIRNLANSGDTPVFRPQANRSLQFAFSGGEDLVPKEFRVRSGGNGHYPTPDEWLKTVKADTVLCFFGFSSSFDGAAGVERFRKELSAYIAHISKQNFNGEGAPKIVLATPLSVEEHPSIDFEQRQGDLELYAKVIAEVAQEFQVPLIDLFTLSNELLGGSKARLTLDGAQLNERGYRELAPLLAEALYGERTGTEAESNQSAILSAVSEKNWIWHNDYNMPNGVHAYGRRYKPFGPDNFPAEVRKLRQIAEQRDHAIHAACRGNTFDLAAADAATLPLPEVKTNYRSSRKTGTKEYLLAEESLSKISVPDGFEVTLFADERRFPSLANPVQMSFDNKGRLWVACMPSYPQWKPGDPRPNDKLIILEDRDGDGKADTETVFADGLHLPLGFELSPEGVYVSEADRLSLLVDIDGDDRADQREVLFYGFDDTDTHHAAGAFCADPSGAIYLSEGTFLHSNVETAAGTVRGRMGGFFRFDPRTRSVTRTAQLSIPNPWGTAFDAWGQPFFLFTSGPTLNWMTRGEMKPIYGRNFPFNFQKNLITAHAVRPTSGLEILSSRHFPDEMQGDILINNTIGFLGTKQHAVSEDGTGYKLSYRQDLLKSSDTNFRPVDLEVAPDGLADAVAGAGAMGFVGNSMVVDTHIEVGYCHTGGMQMSVHAFCLSSRRACARIHPDGTVEQRTDPQWYTPYMRRESVEWPIAEASRQRA